METLIPILKTILTWAMPLIVIAIVAWLKQKETMAMLKPYLPIIAPIAGALLPVAGQALSVWLGIAVDFGPIIELLVPGAIAGSIGVNIYDAVHSLKKKFKKIHLPAVEMVDGQVPRGI